MKTKQVIVSVLWFTLCLCVTYLPINGQHVRPPRPYRPQRPNIRPERPPLLKPLPKFRIGPTTPVLPGQTCRQKPNQPKCRKPK